MKKRTIFQVLPFIFLTLFALFIGNASALDVTVGFAGDGADYTCDGVNDDVQIQAALNAVSAANGGTVTLLEGTFSSDDNIKIYSDTTLAGSGRDVTTLEITPYSGWGEFTPLIKGGGDSPTNIVIHDIKFDGNFDQNSNRNVRGLGQYYTFLKFTNGENIEVYNCEFYDNAYDFVTFWYSSNVKVHDNIGSKQGHEFVYFGSSDGAEIWNNKCDIATDSAFRIENSQNVKIHNNEIYCDVLIGGYSGIYIRGWRKDYPTRNIEVYENDIHNTRYAGIYAYVFDYSDYYGGSGYYDIDDKSQAGNIYIHHNTIDDVGDGTGQAHTERAGIQVGFMHNTTIANNVIHDSYIHGIEISRDDTFGYAHLSDIEIFVENNIISNNNGYGIINLESDTHTVYSDYNGIYGNTYGTFGDGGSGIIAQGTITDNPYYVDADKRDFHLLTPNGYWNGNNWATDTSYTSSYIDAGDPDTDYSNELMSNGGRINIGAYGNTPEASRSYYVEEPVIEEPVVEEPVVEEPVVEDPVSSGDDSIIPALTGELNITYGTASIDGDLSDWQNVEGVIIYGDSDRSSDKDNAATIKALYDDTNLYLAYAVTDTNLQAEKVLGEGGLHLDDGIELYIDTLNNGGTAMQPDDYHFIINLNEAVIDDVGTGIKKDYSYVINMDQNINLLGTLNDASDVDTGYIVEVAVPWADIGGTPSVDTVGLLAVVNDKDSEDSVYRFNYGDVAQGSYAIPDDWADATIKAEPVNTAPEFEATADVSVDEEETISFPVNATDAEGDELTYSATSLPDGATFNAETATFSWTPDVGDAGTYETVFAVTDGDLSDSLSVNIVVNALPVIAEEPVISNDELDITFGTVTIDGDLSDWENTAGVTIYGDSDRSSDKDNVATIKALYDDTNLYLAYAVTDTNLQAEKVLGEGGLHLDDGIELYIDTLNNGGTAMQTDDYHFIINLNEAVIDDVGTGIKKDYSYVINMDQNINLLGTLNDASDVDTGYIIEVAVPWADIGGNPSVDVVGLLAVVNDKDSEDSVYRFNYGDVAQGTYAIPDNWADATIIAAPEEPNTAPQFNAISPVTLTEEETISFTIIAADTEGDELTYSATSLPVGATFDAETATFVWTPADGDAGTHEAVFAVTDGELGDSMSVTIEVEAMNHAPVIRFFEPADGSSYEEGSSVYLNAFATDEDDQALSYVINIDGVQVSTSSSYTWELDYESAGTYTVEVIVSDGVAEVRSTSVVIVTDLHPRWDVNEDGVVSVLDVDIISQNYGATYAGDLPRWDVNQDGTIDVNDISIVLDHLDEVVN